MRTGLGIDIWGTDSHSVRQILECSDAGRVGSIEADSVASRNRPDGKDKVSVPQFRQLEDRT